ncbi:MAG: acyl carrier protein [Eubacteriales bacterium]|jgi:acyl carrier protein|uniref:acyl carrier protein n=1 Tax=Fenollaria TaxID=1686313 RepID=UPI00071DEB20|nr:MULTISPECIES: acyl carrier protein [Fenollaria]MDD7339023.1 acyl carrier protein [Eubacteriales bacterium]MDY3106498.1 acyl carrier protein [Fenollaria sp.]
MLEEKIKEIIAKQFKVDLKDLKDETRFKEDLKADSIAIVELIMNLEDELNVSLDDDKVTSVKTVGEAIALAVEAAK